MTAWNVLEPISDGWSPGILLHLLLTGVHLFHQLARDIAVHHQCLRAALREFDGYEIATEGDSFKCAFHSPEDAICWSTQVQVS